ncbi:MAG: WecB/TagA/CpsF family glycosyltransferase [Chloroflexi bacterium]|nr:WecB/TagA/CpsF family glycosyltransferase [Chloroflexota bacterium]
MANQTVQLLGIRVNAYTYSSWLDQIGHWITEDGGSLKHICTVNPEFLVIAQKEPEFYRVLSQANACIPDGTGVLLAARWLGQKLPSRITGSDGIYRLAERAAADGWRIFLLGAAPGVAEEAAARLQSHYPGLAVVGTYAGSPAEQEAEAIIALVNQSQADILLVAYGAPRQDLWIDRYRDRLAVRMAMGVGGAFDFVAGKVPRAPYWMRRWGLEWLFRLIRQPWRWRRMLRLPVFVWLVLRYGSRPAVPRGLSEAV